MRYPEIDIFRGIAVLMMILFHFLFDLSFFALYPVNVSSGFWREFGYATAISFVLIAGVSVTLNAAKYSSFRDCSLALLRRGGFLICIGMLITFATWIYLGEGYILFGILHLIGTSIILSPLLMRLSRLRFANALIGGGIIIISPYLSSVSGPLYLAWLGVHPDSFYSVDYTPLFPWLGVFMIGQTIGWYLYPGGIRAFTPPSIPCHYLKNVLIWTGRHSLGIYLMHQPVIIGLITLGTLLHPLW
jgi:uncharacterized membrane protein